MKRCKDCGVELETLDDGTFNRVLRCKECRKKQNAASKVSGKNTKSHQTWATEYSRFAETLTDDDICALVNKWMRELTYAETYAERQKIQTIVKILEKEYSLRQGDRILNMEDEYET
jgi:hypothetical protein